MTRRTAELAALLLLAVAILFALPMKAQSHHPDDQLYLPAVYHVARYSTDLTLTNLTPDRVTVDLIFRPINAGDGDPDPLPVYRVRLAPGQSLTEEIGKYGINGQGMLILNVCREFGVCGYTPDTRGNPNAMRYVELQRDMREINVSARVYWTDSNGGTRGDSMTATSWRVEPGIDRLTLSSVTLANIRSDARYRTRIGMWNGSQFSPSCVTATLYDGANVKRGERTECLGPLLGVERSAEEMFPDLLSNRMNRRPPVVGAWVKVVQGSVIPNEQSQTIIGCEDGCPRFDAYAAVTDSSTGDFWFVRSVFEPRTGCDLSPLACRGPSPTALRISAKNAASTPKEGPCTIAGPDRHDGSYLVLEPEPGKKNEAKCAAGSPDCKRRPWMRVTEGELTVARAMCSGTVGQ